MITKQHTSTKNTTRPKELRNSNDIETCQCQNYIVSPVYRIEAIDPQAIPAPMKSPFQSLRRILVAYSSLSHIVIKQR